jgi:hypothetical protein
LGTSTAGSIPGFERLGKIDDRQQAAMRSAVHRGSDGQGMPEALQELG